jgi:hypothetical protein
MKLYRRSSPDGMESEYFCTKCQTTVLSGEECRCRWEE